MSKYDLEVTYKIYLPLTKEYIQETNDDRIWIKCNSSNDAYEDTCLVRIYDLAERIKKDKHLTNIQIECNYILTECWKDYMEVD